MVKKIIKGLFVVIVVGLISIVCLAAMTQTKWFKSKVEHFILETTKKAGWSFKITNLQGSLPFKWKIDALSLQSSEGMTIQAESLVLRLALLPLLRGDIGIAYFSADKIAISGIKEENKESFVFAQLENFPLNISVRHFHIERLEYASLPPMQLSGFFKIQSNARNLFLKAIVKSEGLKQEIFATGGTRKGKLEVHLKLHADHLKPWLGQYDAKGRIQIDIQGPWATWKTLSTKSDRSSAPLTGELFARIDKVQQPDGKTWDQPWKIRCSFEATTDRTITIRNATCRSSLGVLEAEAKILHDGFVKEGSYHLKVPNLSVFSEILRFPANGSLEASGSIKNGTFEGSIAIEKGNFGPLHFQTLHGNSSLFLHEEEWKGTMQLFVEEKNIHLEGVSSLCLAKGRLFFNDFALNAPGLNLGGDLSFDYKTFESEGALRLQAKDLSALDPLFPESGLAGQAGFEINFLKNEGPLIKAFGTFANFQMRHLKIAEGTLALEMQLSKDVSAGSFSLHAERVYLPEVYIAMFNCEASGQNQWNFTIDSQGTWKEPFHLKADGSFLPKGDDKHLILHHLDGTFLNHLVKLKKDSSLDLSSDRFFLEIPSLQLGKGDLAAQYLIDQGKWNLELHGEEIPLAWLALFSPWVSLKGDATLDCHLSGSKTGTFGTSQLVVKDVNAERLGSKSFFQAYGSVFANFNDRVVQVHSQLAASGGQIILLDATLPLLFKDSIFPLRLDPNAHFNGSLLLEGKLEEFSEFFNMGFHRWGGWIAGKALFSNTLVHPLMQGGFTICQGTYENDFIGLKLENIDATIEASHDEFFLTSFIATGPDHTGTLKGSGNLRLRSDYQFPYRFSYVADHLPSVSLDLVEATLTGSGEIEGTKDRAILRGILTINDASFSIPRSLPAEIPDLQVTFINQPAHVESAFSNMPYIFPFHVDIAFHSDDSIHFDAGGLTSVWGGDFHLHGVNLALLASGNLRLAKGQFSLLGKTFQLNQGEISFSDKPGQEGLLNISGTLNLSDVTITAQLRGSLNSPQLTLQSVPPMTTSDIFSLILFNKKVTEIKPMQTVQLARTILSISGSKGWNFVDQIGSGLNILGIDTFDIIPSEEGLNQTSITIGKHFYLVRGVLVSLSQSLSSSKFTVEVDLGKGLIFQAENESDENQAGQVGKLSLKWNKNY